MLSWGPEEAERGETRSCQRRSPIVDGAEKCVEEEEAIDKGAGIVIWMVPVPAIGGHRDWRGVEVWEDWDGGARVGAQPKRFGDCWRWA